MVTRACVRAMVKECDIYRWLNALPLVGASQLATVSSRELERRSDRHGASLVGVGECRRPSLQGTGHLA